MNRLNKNIVNLALVVGMLFGGLNNNICAENTPPPQKTQLENNPSDLDTVLKTNTIELVEWVKNVAKETGNFTKEQTPLFVKEYIQWEIVSNLLKAFFSSCVFFTFVYMCIYFSKKESKSENNWNDPSFNGIMVIISGIVVIIYLLAPFWMTIVSPTLNGIKAIVAPRVVIVEKINNLIKK